MEALGGLSRGGGGQCQKRDPVTDDIKYLAVLMVQPESVPVLSAKLKRPCGQELLIFSSHSQPGNRNPAYVQSSINTRGSFVFPTFCCFSFRRRSRN